MFTNYSGYRHLILPISLWLLSLILVSVQSYQAERAVPSPFARALAWTVHYPLRSYNYLQERVRRAWRNYFYLVGVAKKNLELQKELSFLLLENQRMRAQAEENERLKALLGLKSALNQQAVPAKIISWDLSAYAQTITINIGFQDGISVGQAVVSPQGLIGQVINEPGRVSGAHFAQVLLITDPTSRVSVLIERTRDRGIVQGTGKNDYLLLKYLSPEAKPTLGDIVITSGLGGIFPSGIRVGVVDKIEQDPFSSALQCRVKPSVDFAHLEELLVLTGALKDAQK